MEQRIRNQFNDHILKEIVTRFNLNYQETKLLDGFESYIFYTKRNSQDCVLRISHSIRRSKQQILSELDYLAYLYENKLNVPFLIKSVLNNLVEEAESEDGSFFACLFEFINGVEPAGEMINDNLIMKMGEFLGQLHSLSKKYEPEITGRPDFFRETLPLLDFIPAEDVKIKETANSIIENIRKIPVTDTTYGLIHVDFHFGNFLIRDGEIVLFDFDDCQYSWFVHDIAMPLFYYLPHHDRTEPVMKSGYNFLKNFLTGYRKYNDIEENMLEYIEFFLKIREIELYSLIHRSFDINNLDPWCKSFMLGRKEKLENNQPYFEIDIKNI